MVDWDGEVVLSTPRLLLRTFRRDDRLLYAALNADPEVARYLGGPLSREDSDDIAAWAQECYSRDRWPTSTGAGATPPRPRPAGWTTPSARWACRGSSRSPTRRTGAAWP